MLKKTFLLFIIISLLLSLASVNAEEKRLVAIGDSIPYGYNLSKGNYQPPKEAFPYIIGVNKGIEVTNLSIPGLTSRELLQAIKSNDLFREAIQDTDYLILYIGGNDLLNVVKKNGGLKGIRMEEVAPVIRDLIYNVYSTILEIDQLTDGQILVYNLYNPYPAAGKQLNTPLTYINQQYASLIELLSHFTSVKLVDAFTAFDGHPEYILKGDVHPTKRGQEVLAEITLKKME